MIRTSAPAFVVASALALTLSSAAGANEARLTVVPVEGSPFARAVSTALSADGYSVSQGGGFDPPPPAVPLPLDSGRACVEEGHALAFRLDFSAAIGRLTDCDERLGPALARPGGVKVLSELLVELAAAASAAGEADRARAALSRLSQLAGAFPPDPSVHPPPVTELWTEIRSAPDPSRPIRIEVRPPWARIHVDGRPVDSGEPVALAKGAHYATAEAVGYEPWSGILQSGSDTSPVQVRLSPLEGSARTDSLRTHAGWGGPPDDRYLAEPLTEAFAGPVLLVSGSTTPSAVLLLPTDPATGTRARIGGQWTPPRGTDAANVIAAGVDRVLNPKKPGRRTTLYALAAAALAILAAGTAATFSRKDRPGKKSGTVTWDP